LSVSGWKWLYKRKEASAALTKESIKTPAKTNRPERPTGRKRARSKRRAVNIPRGTMALRIYPGSFDPEVEKKKMTTSAQTIRK
jgi:hypothetical protein